MPRKLEPLTKEEHIEMSKDIRESFKLLEKWQERIWKSSGVKHKASSRLGKAILHVRNNLRDVMDDIWYSYPKWGKSPYYNPEYEKETNESN
tara:strand:+ start:73 stop:348 length:276 start_codon:yes stop_codon:yes gene_type:complete